jgi:hypothetical protein
VAGKTAITITINFCCFLFLCQEWMTEKARHLFFPYPVNFPPFMTSVAGSAIGSERMHRPFMTILTDKLLHENMPGMAA